jgi:hypothetical protein
MCRLVRNCQDSICEEKLSEWPIIFSTHEPMPEGNPLLPLFLVGPSTVMPERIEKQNFLLGVGEVDSEYAINSNTS